MGLSLPAVPELEPLRSTSSSQVETPDRTEDFAFVVHAHFKKRPKPSAHPKLTLASTVREYFPAFGNEEANFATRIQYVSMSVGANAAKWTREPLTEALRAPLVAAPASPTEPQLGPSEFAKKLMVAFGEATRDAVASHLRAGRTVTGIRDGKPTELRPEDLESFIKSRE